MKKIVSLLLCVILALSLCSVTATAAEGDCLEATYVLDESGDLLELVLTAAKPLTNATIRVSFDSSYLSCFGLNVNAEVYNGQMEEDYALVRLAVSTADTIQPGEQVAVLEMGTTGAWDETVVTVTAENWNETVGLNASMDVTITGPGYRFEDVHAGEWFFQAVDEMAADGCIKGISATHFGPALPMNRASFVTLLGRMDGNADSQTQTRFTDVPVESFYSGHVAWADENGIVNGVSQTLFAPANSVTREQMVTFLYRFAKYRGNIDMTVENPEAVLAGFTDADQISEWAVDAFVWAVDRGIINGVTQTTLEPQTVTNRAQVAVMLYRFFY